MYSILNQFTKFEKIIVFIIFVIYFNNLFLDIMAVDAIQYAGMSAEMAKTNSYLEVKEIGIDYLDKPPFLFWISSLSIKIFGTYNFAYKLPSFLFLLFSLFALYRFCLLFYSTKVAKNAVLILATTQSYFLMTNDVRTDAILTSCVIIGVWLFSEYIIKEKLKYLLFASVFVGLAMITKGPIGFIAILMPVGLHLIIKKDWKKVFNVNWLLVILISGIILLPMSYGLYTQFDLHPEKITNGVKGQKGLYFYYWLQSFGRITGENVWNNNTPWHFFIGTSAWDFFPWFFIMFFALFFKFKNIFFKKEKQIEFISIIGFISLFSFLSLSKYKLPHYVFICFPFAAVIVSEYLSKISLNNINKWVKVNYVLGFLVLILMVIYPFLFFKGFNAILIVFIILQIIFLFFYKYKIKDPIVQMISYVIVLNLFFTFVFYPKLLTYQADAMAGKWVKNNLQNENVYLLNKSSHLFNFYSNNPFNKVLNTNEINTPKKTFWLYLDSVDYLEISSKNLKIIETLTFNDYHVALLKLDFLLESKRNTVIDKRYLIKIER